MDSGSKGGCSEEIEVLYMPVCQVTYPSLSDIWE